MYTRTHTGDEPYLKDIHNAHVTHWKVNYSDDVLHVPLVSSSQWQGTPVVSPAIVPGAFMAHVAFMGAINNINHQSIRPTNPSCGWT